MSWLTFALLTILSYSVFDFFVKLSSDKIHTGLGGLIINVVSALVLLAFTVFAKLKGENVLEAKPGGWLYSVLAGITVGLATIFFLKMFSTGTNLSLGVPLVRIGVVVLASILGIILLKEGVNPKYLIGLLFSLVGLYILVTSQ
jgi:uncharacterized membrane protein